ncbi:MAG: gliding motility-associated C-terminal domain-containing protein [Bacteroidetes bacterium]|nr:gliding motility-associated C-terminal domain-containing protein [Bacteroidota bacterium]
MLPSSRWPAAPCPDLRCLVILLLGLASPRAGAQALLWHEMVHGGLITGSASFGTAPSGSSSFELPLPPGSIIHKAVLYGTEVNGPHAATTVKLNDVPYIFGPATQGPGYNSLYGPVMLHSVDLTHVLDPAVTHYTITIPASEASFNRFTEFYLLVTYERPGDAPVWVDVFFADHDSGHLESYTMATTLPMLTTDSVAFATMGGYADNTTQDCEIVRVNGTQLGNYRGGDFNAQSTFGTAGTFFYSRDLFLGLGDDNADQLISGQDVVSNIAGLLTSGTSSLSVEYEHGPSFSPNDNLINLMVVAYNADICTMTLDMGPDSLFCAGHTLVLDATMPDATYHWQDGATTATYPVVASGTYFVDVTSGTCHWSDTVVVDVAPAPLFDLGQDVVLCTNEQAQLDATSLPGATYLWEDGSTDPVRTVGGTGLYHVTATLGACTFTDSIRIAVDTCSFGIVLPNVFSPNGDASNPVFTPMAVRGIASLRITVFNRWGQELFGSSSPQFAWDGRSSAGEPVPAGVYFWTLRYTSSRDPDSVDQRGSVTLVR